MKKLAISITILTVAVILSAIFMPIGFIYSFFLSIYKRNLKYFAKVLDKINVSIDQLGNVVCGDLFNVWFTKKGRNFGLEDDTVSEVLAKNQDNLRLTGKLVSNILEKIEPNHLKKALEENIF